MNGLRQNKHAGFLCGLLIPFSTQAKLGLVAPTAYLTLRGQRDLIWRCMQSHFAGLHKNLLASVEWNVPALCVFFNRFSENSACF